jgi:hypothetical protein
LLLALGIGAAAAAWMLRANFVDDAFTGFLYLENLLAGKGFVFYPGQTPIEGVTNVGWLLLLLPLSAAIGPTLAAKLLGCALLIVAMAMVMRLGQRLLDATDIRGGRPITSASGGPERRPRRVSGFGLTVVPALLLATSFEFVYFSLSGMETALLAVVLLGMALIASRRPGSMALPFLGAAAFLVHPEAALVYPLYLAISRGHGAIFRSGDGDGTEKKGSRPLSRLAVFFVLVGGVTAARLAYFHDWAPNTFHAKPSDAALVVANAYGLLTGENSNVAFPVTGWLAVAVLALGYARLRRAAGETADMLAAICAAGIIFAVYSPTDWTALPRYFAPYLPAALILLWAGLLTAVEAGRALAGRTETSGEQASLSAENPGGQTSLSAENAAATGGRERPPRPELPQLALVGIAAVLLATNVFHSRTKLAAMGEFPGYVLAGHDLVKPAQWMGNHLAVGATIASRRIGAVAYYSRRKVFDYSYGLTDVEVARLVALHGGRFETPTDPALAQVWRARPPEYFLEDGLIMDYILASSGGSRERFLIHGIPYHVIRQFPIGRDSRWILARRMKPGA